MDNKFIIVLSAIIASAQGLNNATHRQFPDYFLFGSATASYQIEGGWEAADKGENIWDFLTHNTNLIVDGSTGDVACDSYNQISRDVEMLKELGVNFYRLSLSWSRILPSGSANKISDAGIAYYNRLIDLLIQNNITPVVTIYHWDLPQPLQDLGGWPNPIMETYFTDFSRVAFEAFGDRVKMWITFNEPYEICQAGYGARGKAPALNMSGIADYLCAHTLIKAHARVYHLYDEVFRPSQDGRISYDLSSSWYEPETNSTEDLEAAERVLQFVVGWYAHPVFTEEGDYPLVFKERIAQRSREQGYASSRLPSFTPEEIEYIKGTYDFFGLNHYTTNIVRAARATDRFPSPSFEDDQGAVMYQRNDWPGSASSWLKVVPWGFRKILNWIKDRYNNPEIVIFENGFSDRGGVHDADRISYYHQYLNAMLDAMEDGATVSGFTAWSLMDNFEWLFGYTEKFGLYEVDFESPNRTRTAKDSARYYGKLIRNRILKRDDSAIRKILNSEQNEIYVLLI